MLSNRLAVLVTIAMFSGLLILVTFGWSLSIYASDNLIPKTFVGYNQSPYGGPNVVWIWPRWTDEKKMTVGFCRLEPPMGLWFWGESGGAYEMATSASCDAPYATSDYNFAVDGVFVNCRHLEMVVPLTIKEQCGE